MRTDKSQPGMYAGKSLYEILWDHLLAADERTAPGLAEAMAVFINPYQPNVDRVREEYQRRMSERKR